MLPGKKYTPEDYLRMGWRRRWWIAIPTMVISLSTVVITYFLPNVYMAETVILIVPQSVPQEFVRSTITGRLDERLNMISQQILSRTRLERIMQEANLYEKERKTMIMEDVIQRMRRDITINPERGRQSIEAFRVGFRAPNPRTALTVTERLATMLVNENLQDRERSADATSQFLTAQLEDARKRLIEHEQRLAQFRSRNSGQLPTQVDSNLQLMSSTQLQLQNLTEANNRDRDRAVQVDREIGAILAQLALPLTTDNPTPTPTPTGDPGAATPVGGSTAELLASARENLKLLEKRWRPDHPDIRRAKVIVAELEDKAKAEAANPAPPKLTSRTSAAVQEHLARLRKEFQELELRIDGRRRQETQLQAQLATYRARLETTPALESELSELMRDYGTLGDTYRTLLQKSEESKIAVNLERRQIGEQFRVLDTARLPERPISPNRPRLNLMGLLAGMCLGLGLVALLEWRDTTIKTDSDVTVSLSLPVLAVIPMMRSAADRRREKSRRRLLVAVSVGFVLLVVAGVALWNLGVLARLVA